MDTVTQEHTPQIRPVIVKTVAVCLAIAMAPWLTGGQEPLGRLVSGFALLLGALLLWKQPEARRLRRGPLMGFYGLLMVLAVLSLLWTANRYSSTVWILQWVTAGLAFWLAYSISGQRVGKKWILGAYVVSAAVFSLVAMVMYLTSEYGRLTGTFYWANPAAAYLIPAILLGVDGIRRGSGRQQWFWWGASVVWLAAFLLTDSRAASAVLLVVLAMYFVIINWLKKAQSKRYWILILFTVLAGFALSFGLVKLSTVTVHHTAKVAPGSRLSEAVKGESSSGSDRLYYLGSVFNMWKAHPLLGVGAGAYGDVHPQYQQRVISASTNAHNIFAQELAELGILGVVLLAGVMVTLLLGVYNGLLRRPEQLAAALGVLGLLMHFGLDIDASYPTLMLLVGSLLGVLYAQNNAQWVKPGWLWPVLAGAMIVPLTSLYISDAWAVKGRAAQDDGNYAVAADDFSRAGHQLVFNPDVVSAEGINLYGLASVGEDSRANIELALERARRAEQLDGHDAQHYQLEGRVLAFERKFAEAEKASRRALELDRLNHPDYAADLVFILVQENRSAEALRVAAAMLDLYTPAVINNRVADETLRPQLANLEALRGNIYLAQGKMSEAGVAAKRALALDKDNLRGRALQHQVDVTAKPVQPE